MTTATKQKLSDAEVRKIIEDAQADALRFTKAYLEQHPCEYPCGFAWVNIKPARGQFVKVMKQMGIGRTDEYYGGYTFWNPSQHSTQNMDAKLEGARVFARELRKYGINARENSRLD